MISSAKNLPLETGVTGMPVAIHGTNGKLLNKASSFNGCKKALMNDKILGIDLGTTHSAVAVVDAGFPLILADRDGNRLTPSVVHYPAGGGEPKVGHEALRMRSTAPKRTVYDVKRFMGRRTTDLKEDERNIGYELSTDPGSPIEVLMGESSVRPESVSAAVLAHLKRVAESAMEASLIER